jgi:hypothetical protein
MVHLFHACCGENSLLCVQIDVSFSKKSIDISLTLAYVMSFCSKL